MGLAISFMWRRLLGPTEMKIVLVGLDNAGKTTILYKLCLDDLVQTSPTVGSNVEELTHKNVKLQAWDLGGQDKLRAIWKTYYVGAHAVVLVVDSTDRARMPQVRAELKTIVEHDELRGAVLLVFANKQDVDGAMSPAEISAELELHTQKQHPWQIFASSAVKGDGLYEGLDWLVHSLKAR